MIRENFPRLTLARPRRGEEIHNADRRGCSPCLHGNNDPSDNNSTEDDVGAVATLFG